MENKILSVNNLGKTFIVKKKKVEALRNICLEASEREIIAIMGPSGCGKTTLAKILAGIDVPSEGSFSMFGQDCTKGVSKELRRRIGFIYQDNNLLPWRTVEENLRFPLEIFGVHKQEKYIKLIDEALEIVGLSAYRTCLPQELSGGMMQRVGIARALALDPELLVMDQPFGALDAITRKKLRYDFLKIFEKAQKTIIIITNSIDEALLFANRVYVMGEAPGTIEHVVNVDVPFEERTTDITTNEKFRELRAQMIKIIKAQYENDGIMAEGSEKE